MRRAALATASVLSAVACSTAGSAWMSEPMTAKDEDVLAASKFRPARERAAPRDPNRFATRSIGGEEPPPSFPGAAARTGPSAGPSAPSKRTFSGRALGTFRNTYYDFPAESEFAGDPVALRDVRCGVIAQVPRPFADAVCVQGSGILAAGRTVSFAKRDCDCAEMCPKTGQKICFEALDPARFPWGRGALGTAITPLLTVAVDDALIPMGTAIYVPEMEGLPTEANGSGRHDGCFVAQDRGLRVKGEHVDVFTGYAAMTALWNRLLPSNHGVTVVVDEPRCARAELPKE